MRQFFAGALIALASAQEEVRNYRMWEDVSDVELVASTAYQSVIDDIASTYNYSLVRHPGIVTNDDYVLELWQMAPILSNSSKNTKGNLRAGRKSSFLLGHGMQANGVAWFGNGADSIAFKLADADNDVWILHDRSTSVSTQHHVSLDILDPLFWDFGFEEIGANDIPAAIDYIQDQNKLNSDKWDMVSYVGHGSGATSILSALGMQKEYFAENVSSVVALAPITRMNYADEDLFDASFWVYPILNHIYKKGYNHLNESNQVIDFTGDVQVLRSNGFWSEQVSNESDVDVVLEQVSRWIDEWLATFADFAADTDNAWGYANTANTSMKIINHFSQFMKEMSTPCFDYLDNDVNFAAYGQTEPPQIPFDMIDTTPVMLVAAADDNVASPTDVLWMESVLANNYTGEAAANLAYWNIVGGHNSALQGADMSYFDDQVLPWATSYLP